MGHCNMMGTPIVIGETEYLIRYPVSSLIKAETELGKPIGAITGAYSELAILVKHGLKHPDGSAMSKKEYEELLENIEPVEFAELTNAVAAVVSGSKNPASDVAEGKVDSGKN